MPVAVVRATFLSVRVSIPAVKYFNAEEHEVQRYTQSLWVYEDHQLRVTTTLAGLNFGQNMIFSTAMTAMLVMAAEGVAAGTHSGSTNSLGPPLG